MSDRIKGFTVSLEKDMKDEDAEVVRQAILALRHVLFVRPVATNIDDLINRDQIRRDLELKLYEVLRRDK